MGGNNTCERHHLAAFFCSLKISKLFSWHLMASAQQKNKHDHDLANEFLFSFLLEREIQRKFCQAE